MNLACHFRTAAAHCTMFALAFVLACTPAGQMPPVEEPQIHVDAPVPDVPVTVALDRGPAPQPLREFRGLWVASVGNMDWPSRAGLTPDQQRAELLSIMDRAQ